MTWLLAYTLNVIYVLALPVMIGAGLVRGKRRGGLREKLFGLVSRRRSDRPCVWFHAVSVGEANLIAPLVAELSRRRPDVEMVVSTTTRAGHETARRRYPRLTVFYCPFDFTWAVARAMRRIRPQVLLVAETELWPNLIFGAKRAGAAVCVVNGRLGERSHRGYRRIRPIIAQVLRRLDVVAVQNDTYAARFIDLGARPETVRVTGSLKFDGATTDRGNAATTRLALLAGFDPRDVVFLAGSTQAPEEASALSVFRRLAPRFPELRLVLVPRHPERFDAVAHALDTSGVRWQRRSELVNGANPRARILLVDAVGELAAWWGTARIAFVGGSLGNRGGQNMMEPAAYGAALSFGPNTWNFAEATAELIAAEAAVVVRDEAELAAFVERCADDPAYAARLGERAKAWVARHLGAAGRTADLVEALLDGAPPATREARGAARPTRRPTRAFGEDRRTVAGT